MSRVVVLAALLLSVPLVARAQDASTELGADVGTCDVTPSDAEVRQRLALLDRDVRREEPPVRRWWTTFAVLHGTMATGAAIFAGSAEDETFRNEMLVGTTSSVLAIATLLIFTPPLMGAGDALRGYAIETPAERLAKLRAAEDMMRRAARGVDFLRGWFPATLTLVYLSLAAGTLLLAFERPTGAYSHVVGGSILGLGRILTHPVGARTAWRAYLRRYPDAACEEPVATGPGLRFRAGSSHGVGLTLSF